MGPVFSRGLRELGSDVKSKHEQDMRSRWLVETAKCVKPRSTPLPLPQNYSDHLSCFFSKLSLSYLGQESCRTLLSALFYLKRVAAWDKIQIQPDNHRNNGTLGSSEASYSTLLLFWKTNFHICLLNTLDASFRPPWNSMLAHTMVDALDRHAGCGLAQGPGWGLQPAAAQQPRRCRVATDQTQLLSTHLYRQAPPPSRHWSKRRNWGPIKILLYVPIYYFSKFSEQWSFVINILLYESINIININKIHYFT